MGKILKSLQNLFEGKELSVEAFDELLAEMPEDKREKQLYELGQLAYGYFEKVPRKYQNFIRKYYNHNRDAYTDYLKKHTVAQFLRCELEYPWLFLKLLHFLEEGSSKKRKNYLLLAAALSLAFIIPEKVNSLSKLSKYIRLVHVLPEEFLRLIGKIDIGGDDYL